MILQVHDELVFEVPDPEAEELASLVRERMESVYALEVPSSWRSGLARIGEKPIEPRGASNRGRAQRVAAFRSAKCAPRAA